MQCREALTTRQKLIAQDYKVSYSLARSCKSDLRKQRCNTDSSLPRAREARLSSLLLCLEAAVHRGGVGSAWVGAGGGSFQLARCWPVSGRVISGECQGEMMDYRRMLMEDFSLSPEIVLHCRSQIESHCSGLHRKGRTLHCLMRISRMDAGTIQDNCQTAVRPLPPRSRPPS